MFDQPKAAKILAKMLGTTHDGERLTAASMLANMVNGAGIAPSDVLVFPRGDEPIRDKSAPRGDSYEVRELKATIRARDIEIKGLKRERDNYDESARTMTNIADRLADTVNALKADIASKAAEISTLKATIERQRTTRGKVTALENEIAALKAENARLQADLAEARTQAPEPAQTAPTGPETPEEPHADPEPKAATVETEFRKIHQGAGWVSALWQLLARRGLRRNKATVYAWVAGRARMPGDVISIIRKETARLARAGYSFLSARWWENELARMSA